MVSPAGPVDEMHLRIGVRRLEEWGYRVEIAPHVLSKHGYLAGEDPGRLADLVAALTDPDIRGVICSRGGYGSHRLLKDIPWSHLRAQRPRVFVGFSDIGAIQLALWSRSGWVTFSGPQVAMGLGGSLTSRSADHLRAALEGTGFRSSRIEDTGITLTPVRPGGSAGVLVPCCLTILTSLLATDFFPDLEGAVLCIEDTGEPLYRIDRMLWQLRASKRLNHIGAMVLGHFLWRGDDQAEAVARVALEHFAAERFPLWRGLPYGHVDDRLTLPVGAEVVIDETGVMRLKGRSAKP